VWALEDDEIVENIVATIEPNARRWIFVMMESMGQVEFVKVPVTLWAIWIARRKAIHKGEFWSPLSTHHFVRRYIGELKAIPKPGELLLNLKL
jgi:cell division protein FtsW (lipid II flippase)